MSWEDISGLDGSAVNGWVCGARHDESTEERSISRLCSPGYLADAINWDCTLE